jgi:hypothetical protein
MGPAVRFQRLRLREAVLVAQEVERAVQRDPIGAVLDGKLADRIDPRAAGLRIIHRLPGRCRDEDALCPDRFDIGTVKGE